jgi:hypothetical protein
LRCRRRGRAIHSRGRSIRLLDDGERSWQPPLGLRHRLRCRPKGRGGFAVAAAKSGYWTNGEWNWHRRST